MVATAASDDDDSTLHALSGTHIALTELQAKLQTYGLVNLDSRDAQAIFAKYDRSHTGKINLDHLRPLVKELKLIAAEPDHCKRGTARRKAGGQIAHIWDAIMCLLKSMLLCIAHVLNFASGASTVFASAGIGAARAANAHAPEDPASSCIATHATTSTVEAAPTGTADPADPAPDAYTYADADTYIGRYNDAAADGFTDTSLDASVDVSTDVSTDGLVDSSADASSDAPAAASAATTTSLVGERVELRGLVRAAHLNGTRGIVLRADATGGGRLVVRREVVCGDADGTSVNLTVRREHVCAVPRIATLAELQRFVDAAPVGARVSLPRGVVEVGESAGADSDSGGGVTGGGGGGTSLPGRSLILRQPIRLNGAGCKVGGTVLQFGITTDADLSGELLELGGLHICGPVELAPWDVQSVRLCRLAVSVGAESDVPAVRIDEVGLRVPPPAEAAGRVMLEDCWVRGGGVGVRSDAVGTLLRRCRVQGAGTYGLHVNARVTIDECVIGNCVLGGILARGGVDQLRNAAGLNSNRVQRDAGDKRYSGYVDGCVGCIGRCTCAAMYAYAALTSGGLSGIRWGGQGQGSWQMGCQL